ncbi:MAG: DNA primase [bacterium]|nr:DNA primase [bacterium]
MVNNVDKVKEKVDIVDLISGYLKLQKSGVNYKANCPFHNEKTPSFTVSSERQFWHCFGCSRGGDHFTFVQEIEGVDFPEALRILARRAGIELEQFDRSFQNDKTRLLDISALAVKFFQKQLWESNSGQKALAYLKNRGLKEETVNEHKLGFAPDSWQSFIDFLKSRNFRDQEIFDAGLSVRRENSSGYYDRFRSRIMFPVFDLNGQAVGFTGRIFETHLEPAEGRESGAKYINTPQTLIYDKSKILYGLNAARMHIRSQDRCLLMEGNMDVIMSHQAGVLNAIASSGTALTDQHLKTIGRYTRNLDLCFDQDSAGQHATDRGISLAFQHDFNLGVVVMTDQDCKDPADFVQKYGEKWQEKAKDAQSIFNFYIETACRQFDPATANGKKAIAQKVLPLIKKIVSPVERSHWIGELALRIQTKEDDLNKEMGQLAGVDFVDRGLKAIGPEKEKFVEWAGSDVLEDYLISLLMIKPDLVRQADHASIGFCPEKVKSFFTIFENYLNNPKPGNPVDYLIQTASQEASADKMYLEKVYLKARERWPIPVESGPQLQEEFKFILNRLQRKNASTRLAELEMAIKQAGKKKDKKLELDLVKEVQNTAYFLNK